MRSIPNGTPRKLIQLCAAPLMILMLWSASASAQEGSVDAGRQKSTTCSACHGQDGNSVANIYPSLAGLGERYIARQLKAYQNGERESPIMAPLVADLSDSDISDLAAFFSAQTMQPKGADPELVGMGEDVYRGGVADRGIAACIGCHGPGGHGNPLAGFPRISGQHATYLTTTLKAFSSGERRSDSDHNQMMRDVAQHLTDDEIDAVASYVQGLR